jgi:hypothetical protein
LNGSYQDTAVTAVTTSNASPIGRREKRAHEQKHLDCVLPDGSNHKEDTDGHISYPKYTDDATVPLSTISFGERCRAIAAATLNQFYVTFRIFGIPKCNLPFFAVLLPFELRYWLLERSRT